MNKHSRIFCNCYVNFTSKASSTNKRQDNKYDYELENNCQTIVIIMFYSQNTVH